MDIQTVCEDVVTETEGALGCLAIDLDTGLVLASAHPPDAAMDEAEIESALRYAIEMFRGRFIDRFMRSMLTDRKSAAGFVREAQVTTDSSYLFIATIPGWENGAVVLAAQKTLTLGLAWMAVHQAQERIVEFGQGVLAPGRPDAASEPASSQSAGGATQDANRALKAAAPAAPAGEKSTPEIAAPEEPSAVAPTGHPATTPGDPKPIPPPREESASQPIPNPLMANKHRVDRLKATTPTPGETPESGAQDAPAARPRMFRRRSRKKDRN